MSAAKNSVHPLVLHLVLTGHWFDEMVAGRKHVEYRRCTPHWRRLLWDRRKRITHARFSRGYTSKTILRPVLAVDCGGCPYDGWDGRYYRLHLGNIVENASLDRPAALAGTVGGLVRASGGSDAT